MLVPVSDSNVTFLCIQTIFRFHIFSFSLWFQFIKFCFNPALFSYLLHPFLVWHQRMIVVKPRLVVSTSPASAHKWKNTGKVKDTSINANLKKKEEDKTYGLRGDGESSLWSQRSFHKLNSKTNRREQYIQTYGLCSSSWWCFRWDILKQLNSHMTINARSNWFKMCDWWWVIGLISSYIFSVSS